MKNNTLRKGLVLGIIILFIGAGFTSILVIGDQPPEEEWNRIFGGAYYDTGESVHQTTDGGYIIAGTTDNYSGIGDIWLIKTDQNGIIQWNHTFGGIGYDTGYCVQQTTDDGYIIVGDYIANESGTWVWNTFLIKTDEQGNEEWNKTLGVEGFNYTSGVSVQQTSDGGYIIGGTTVLEGVPDNWNAFLIKTDIYGVKEWDKSFGALHDDYGESVQQTSDGGYIITGETSSYGEGDFDVWLIKTNSSGEEQWNKTFGGPYEDRGLSVKQTMDGGYIITGDITFFVNETWACDVYLVKTDENGTEEWNTTFGGNESDYGRSVLQNVDGDYVIIGNTYSYGNGNVWLIKTDDSGNEKWNITFDGGWAKSGEQTADEGYIITGSTGWDVLLIKTASDIEPPIAGFTFTPENPTTEDVIQFTDTSNDPDGTIVSWWWNFGNQYFSDLQNTTYCYYEAGAYNVNLTVTDNKGVNDSYETVINVSDVVGVITDLQQRWNLMGLPDDTSIAKEELIVHYNGINYSWHDATTGSDPIVLGFIYGWNRTAQIYMESDGLYPGYGYWMWAYYNCSLFRP